jgi:S-adenosylmethionine:tRNA ribosyltransferase-isomerase
MWTLDHFNYSLPQERIAQMPLAQRDQSRLLVLDRQSGELEHKRFFDLETLLQPGDVLVRNNTKVLPARLFGTKPSGGKGEILLVRQIALTPTTMRWECLTRPGMKVGKHMQIAGTENLVATCVEITGFTRVIEFNQDPTTFFQSIDQAGHTPIPPYIEWEQQDEQKLRQVYQTLFAKLTGSVAAPTAGLHFTAELDEKLRAKGIQIEEVTLHVGLGTFLPVQDEQIKTKTLHQEWFQLSPETAERINTAKANGQRIIAVGTTTTRVLETCSAQNERLAPQTNETTLFIQPPYKFNCIDGLITNFHLPQSSLLMLVSAFVSEPNTPHHFSTFAESSIGRAYETAIQEKYRFFSFGDAMFIH